MSLILYTTAFNLMEYWIFILLLQYVCAADMDLRRRNCIIGTAVSALLIAASFFLGTGFDYPAMLLSVLLTIILFAEKKFSAVLRLLPAYAIYFTLSVIPGAMLEILFPAMNKTFQLDGYTAESLLSVVIDIILLCCLAVLVHAMRRRRFTAHFGVKETLGSMALLFFTFINGQLMTLMNNQHHPLLMHCIYASIFWLAFIFSVGYYVYVIIDAQRRTYLQAKVQNEMEYMELRIAALADTKESAEQTRCMRHDLNKHLAVIKTLCDDGKYTDVCQYIDQLNEENLKSGNRLPTGNETVDLIVGHVKKLCEEHNIEFVFEGILSGMRDMPAPDICSLLTNAYDNAIEACIPQSNAYIRTKIYDSRDYVVIQIVNSVAQKIPVRNNCMPTSKKDKNTHGYGTKIMKQTARRYNGSCTFKCNEKEFCVKIILPA